MTTEPKPAKARKKSKDEIARDELIRLASELDGYWMEFRKLIRRSFSAQPIGAEDEQTFLDLKSHMTRQQRVLSQRLPPGFPWAPKTMNELMGQTISLASLRELPASDKKSLYARWHQAYVALQHMLGTMDLMGEGLKVTFQVAQAKSGNLKADIAMQSRGVDKMARVKQFLKIVVVLAVLAVAAWFVMKRLG